MSTDTPEKLVPQRLDPRKLALQGAVFSGRIPVDALSRLQQAIAKLEHVSANLEFGLADQGERLMCGTVVADVELVCQRCLESFNSQVASDFALAAVWDEEEAKQLASAYDPWITGEGEGDVYDVIEEELLLSLPLVAYHSGECIDSSLLSSGKLPEDTSEEKPNPFQVLEQLKGNVKK